MASILSEIPTLNSERLLAWYLPLLLGTVTGVELLDFFTRRYFESFSGIFYDYSNLKFFRSILYEPHPRLYNYPREKLVLLVNRYNESVRDFLKDWVWRIPNEIVNALLVVVILFCQSPKVLVVNIALMVGYFLLAFYLSARISILSRKQSEAQVASGGLISSLTHNLGTLSKLGLIEFFSKTYQKETVKIWERIWRVSDFHAQRWFLQLNLFNFV